MPYKNEHSCRLRDPDLFKQGTFRSRKGKIAGKPVRNIFAKHKKTGSIMLQSIRFPKKYWTKEQAEEHCNGKFEPAKE